MPNPLHLNTVIPSRLLKDDIARLRNTNVAAAPGAAFASDPNAPQGLPASGAVIDGRGIAPAIGAGPRGQQIADRARFLMQTRPNERNYFTDINESCASFVSMVLIDVGILRHKITAALALAPAVAQAGAVQVIALNTPNDTVHGKLLEPGDICIFRDPAVSYHHSGIAVGPNQMIAAGSSSGYVHQYPPKDCGHRLFVGVWRFPA